MVATGVVTVSDALEFVVHLSPVWREHANFIIDARIEEAGLPRRYEQLWARKVDDNHFKICCIPFFVYDLSLGDEVATNAQGDRQYVIESVVKPSNRFTFRAWFEGSSSPTIKDEVVKRLRELGANFEWYSKNLLGVDAEDLPRAEGCRLFACPTSAAGSL
jgi:hypothetical protein